MNELRIYLDLFFLTNGKEVAQNIIKKTFSAKNSPFQLILNMGPRGFIIGAALGVTYWNYENGNIGRVRDWLLGYLHDNNQTSVNAVDVYHVELP